MSEVGVGEANQKVAGQSVKHYVIRLNKLGN